VILDLFSNYFQIYVLSKFCWKFHGLIEPRISRSTSCTENACLPKNEIDDKYACTPLIMLMDAHIGGIHLAHRNIENFIKRNHIHVSIRARFPEACRFFGYVHISNLSAANDVGKSGCKHACVSMVCAYVGAARTWLCHVSCTHTHMCHDLAHTKKTFPILWARNVHCA